MPKLAFPQKRNKLTTVSILNILTIAITSITVILLVFLFTMERKMAGRNCEQQMHETAVATARHIDDVFIENENSLHALARLLGTKEDLLSEDSLELINLFGSFLPISRLRILFPDNSFYASDGQKIANNDVLDFESIIKYNEKFSKRNQSIHQPENNVIRQFIPVYKEGSAVAIICCTYICSDFADMVDIKSYSDNCDFILIDRRNGDILSDSYAAHGANGNINTNRNRNTKNGEEFGNHITKMLNGETGHTTIYSIQGGEYLYYSYVPSHYDEFEVLVFTNERLAYSGQSNYELATIIITVIIMTMLIGFAFWTNKQFFSIKLYYSHDPLTGALNRYGLFETFSSIKDKAAYIGIMIFDIDHFKKVNDNYGHLNGDIVLKELAAVVMSCLPPTATLHRWGGEEFAVVYKDGTKAIDNANYIFNQVRAHDFKLENTTIHITISAGLALSTAGASEAERDRLLKEADHLLYNAKEGGRDRLEYIKPKFK